MNPPKQHNISTILMTFQRIPNTRIILLLPILSLFLSSCNQVFYQPTRVVYDLPSRHQFAYEEHRIAFSKDEYLVAWEIRPKTSFVKGTILHFHGNAENMTSHFRFMLPMVRLGYRVVTFDYRGYGFSDGTASRAGLQQDAMLMINFVHERENYKNAPLYVIAQSLGGAIAVDALASKKNHRFAALILDSTFGSYRLMARSVLDRIWLTWPLQWPLSFLVTNHANPMDAAGRITIRTLFVHGEADRIVPLKHGRMLYDAISARCKQFLSLPGEGHTTIFRKGHQQFDQVAQFLLSDDSCQK